jgi:formate hydrogenlyase subunit 3/multisubunit Na+/H+ antiporter MnhD subunit
MSAPQLVIAAMQACGIGALLTLFTARYRKLTGYLAFAATLVASWFIFQASVRVLTVGPEAAVSLWSSKTFGFALRIHVDGLSAIFLMLIACVVPAAAFYSIGYLEQHRDRGVDRYYPHLLLFVTGMIGLVATSDAMFFFFIFWQLMTLPSFALIRFENEKVESRRAAWKYFVMMQIACLATMWGAELLVQGHPAWADESLKYDFDAISAGIPDLMLNSPGKVTFAFALMLLGFGIKAGMWPFGQFWLPDAHPAAPSPISALLSGVMIKTGVYGLLRTFLWLVPVEARFECPLQVWGVVIAVMGTITMVAGTSQALYQTQAKRLLAFSSIGQIGYILFGLGTCLALIQSPLVWLAAIALYGTLFHTVNHGLFKSLLFLNAGSVLNATGTQDIGKLGGLMRYMPVTGVVTLIGSFCIAGVPLTNGFASKWSLYAAAFQGSSVAKVLPILAVIAIGTSALTLAVFMRFFGAMFLSRTSQLVANKAALVPSLEVNWQMRMPKLFLAGLCLVLGLFPALGYFFIQSALQTSGEGLAQIVAHSTPANAGIITGIAGINERAVIAPLAVAVVLVSMYMLARWLSKLGGSTRRVVTPWLCGYALEAENNRYHAHNFYAQISGYFRRFHHFLYEATLLRFKAKADALPNPPPPTKP